jgi:hypothetical protein
MEAKVTALDHRYQKKGGFHKSGQYCRGQMKSEVFIRLIWMLLANKLKKSYPYHRTLAGEMHSFYNDFGGKRFSI